MLTGHAFNAMLKTLEEPPSHLKFILATTDPQKIPVTVLSRCLQFNLKQMTVPAIEHHLDHILQQEHIQAEAPALRLLSQAAHGSMRDALSLTDQAISYSAGVISTQAVQGMLGTIDQAHLVQLLDAVIQHDAAALVQLAEDMQVRGLSFGAALADLAVLLSRIAIQQRVAGALPADETNREAIERLATQLSPDHVQLFYSIVVHSRDELALAPDECAGFIMAALRLLSLMPAKPLHSTHNAVSTEKLVPPAATSQTKNEVSESSMPEPVEQKTAPQHQVLRSGRAGVQPPIVEKGGYQINSVTEVDEKEKTKPALSSDVSASKSAAEDLPPWETELSPPVQTQSSPVAADQASVLKEETKSVGTEPEEPPLDEEYDSLSQHEYDADFSTGDNDNGQIAPPDEAIQQAVAALALPETSASIIKPQQMNAAKWAKLAPTLGLSGWAAELAQQAEWLECEDNQVTIRVAIRSADDSQAKARINTVLNEYFGQAVVLNIEYGSTGDETAYALAEAERAERQSKAENDAQQNAFILALQTQFDAQLITNSVRAK